MGGQMVKKKVIERTFPTVDNNTNIKLKNSNCVWATYIKPKRCVWSGPNHTQKLPSFIMCGEDSEEVRQ